MSVYPQLCRSMPGRLDSAETPSWFSSFLSSQREGQRGWGVHSLLVSLFPSGIPWQFTFPHGHSSYSLTPLLLPVTDTAGFRGCPLSSRPRRPQIPFCPACSPRGTPLCMESRDLVHLQNGMLSGKSREENSTITEAAHVESKHVPETGDTRSGS